MLLQKLGSDVRFQGRVLKAWWNSTVTTLHSLRGFLLASNKTTSKTGNCHFMLNQLASPASLSMSLVYT